MRRTLLIVCSIVASLLIVACSASATPTPAPTKSPSAVPTAATGVIVQLSQSSLGMILTDASGNTLYGFIPDQTAGIPTCYTTCAGTWPALPASVAFTVGTGLDQSLFKLVQRTDGVSQLQFGQFPLYHYAGDAKAGDVNGQGKGTNWYVLGVDGQQIKSAGAVPAGASPSAGPSYSY